MKIGYARVSTGDQTPALQLAALKKAGCDKIFTDKLSGALRKRPQLDKCLQKLTPDDVLVVWKLDRLGRSLRDLITLLDNLKGQGIRFKSLTESIDTHTPTGRAMWQMIGVLAELERSLIRERTKAGREAAMKRGVKMGRKPKLSPHQIAHARTLIDKGESPPLALSSRSSCPWVIPVMLATSYHCSTRSRPLYGRSRRGLRRLSTRWRAIWP